jgi:hypothetical protein
MLIIASETAKISPLSAMLNVQQLQQQIAMFHPRLSHNIGAQRTNVHGNRAFGTFARRWWTLFGAGLAHGQRLLRS